MTATRTFDYQQYLASREWGLLREQVRERAGNKCERCGAAMQAVHHLTYERIGHELLEDLQAICNPCHEFVSGRSEVDPARYVFADLSPAMQVWAEDAWPDFDIVNSHVKDHGIPGLSHEVIKACRFLQALVDLRKAIRDSEDLELPEARFMLAAAELRQWRRGSAGK